MVFGPFFKKIDVICSLCYSHTQPGHEPDLMQEKMGENSPGIDGNLHMARVETARYGSCIRI
jgi:hypothetical protein